MELLTNTAESQTEMRERLFEDVYRQAFPAFARYASKRNASLDDAKDIFHDALIAYYEKTLIPSFTVRISPAAYVLGIARHLWLKKFRRDRNRETLGDTRSGFELAAETMTVTDAEVTLLKLLQRSGRKCLDLLNKFYFERASLREIAAGLGYKTEHSAAVQKYKCLGKIRDEVRAQSIRYEDINF